MKKTILRNIRPVTHSAVYALQDRTYTLVCRLRSSLHAAGMEIVKEQDGYRFSDYLYVLEWKVAD